MSKSRQFPNRNPIEPNINPIAPTNLVTGGAGNYPKEILRANTKSTNGKLETK